MRYFLISIFIHILTISFVWVGFSVSAGPEQNSFTYLGELVATTGASSQRGFSKGQLKLSDTKTFTEESSRAFFMPWLKMREVNKPR